MRHVQQQGVDAQQDDADVATGGLASCARGREDEVLAGHAPDLVRQSHGHDGHSLGDEVEDPLFRRRHARGMAADWRLGEPGIRQRSN